MKTTRVLVVALLTSAFTAKPEGSVPFEKTQANVYQTYKDTEIPLPNIYKDRKSVTLTSILKRYGHPPLPHHYPPAWQFKGQTTSAAAYGEWFCLYKMHYPHFINQPAKYVANKHGQKCEIMSLVIEIRYFPNTQRPAIVYDAFYEVRKPNVREPDFMNMSNPAFPPIKWAPDIVAKYKNYVNAAPTEWNREFRQIAVARVLKKEQEAAKRLLLMRMNNFKNNVLSMNKK